ncbi:hypothetical protein [Streptacidiphilus albus]|uniref:hypothetical protein n=1 Tax=Streptacidiphilus albus TaxID=105425 RepID=UPI00054C5CC7|nr:hypothetical protein [Streptacidiphilus albus]
MIHIAETLSIHTVEGFLTHPEVHRLNELMDLTLEHDGRDRYDVQRSGTIHEIPDLPSEQARIIYEPLGRLEMTELPPGAQSILDTALDRTRPSIVRALPSITGHRPWIFLEYQAGQHITAHADGIAPDPSAWPRQIAAASVTIRSATDGSGSFYVETSGSDAPWTPSSTDIPVGYTDGMRFTHDGADCSSPWFNAMQRTRWTVHSALGSLVVFGSQLVHGTEPVGTGTVRKFLTLLTAEEKPPSPGRR